MKRKPLNRTTLLIATIALCVIIAAGATYAWFTATASRVNRFETVTLDGTVSLFERFEPPKDWKPGTEIDKQVGVINSGDLDVFTRISFHEMLKLLSLKDVLYEDEVDLPNGTKIPVLCNPSNFTTDAAWSKLTVGQFTGGLTEFPNDIIIYGNKDTSTNTYGYFAYRKVSTDPDPEQFQRVDLEPGAILYDSVADKFTLNTNHVKYCYFTGYQTAKKPVWVSDLDPTATEINYPPLLLNGFTFNPDTKINKAMSSDLIELFYDKLAPYTDLSLATTEGKWVYSEGYFYYIGILKPGNVTPLLLSSVKLSKDAGNLYQHLVFDLNVEMQAVQANADSLEDVWKINKPSTQGKAIYDRLVGLIP